MSADVQANPKFYEARVHRSTAPAEVALFEAAARQVKSHFAAEIADTTKSHHFYLGECPERVRDAVENLCYNDGFLHQVATHCSLTQFLHALLAAAA